MYSDPPLLKEHKWKHHSKYLRIQAWQELYKLHKKLLAATSSKLKLTHTHTHKLWRLQELSNRKWEHTVLWTELNYKKKLFHCFTFIHMDSLSWSKLCCYTKNCTGICTQNYERCLIITHGGILLAFEVRTAIDQ